MAEVGRTPRKTASGDPVASLYFSRIHMAWIWRLLTVLVAILPMGGMATSALAESPRAALHEDFGRMVIDWDGPVTYSADVMNGELVLRFDRPVAGDFHAVLPPLAKYLKGVSVSPDHRTATFPLTHPIDVKAFTNAAGAVVIDLREPTDPNGTSSAVEPDQIGALAAALQGADAPVSLLPTSPNAPVKAPAPAPKAAPPGKPTTPVSAAAETGGKPPLIDIRAGEHGAYNRLVFDWPKAVGYTVDKQGDQALIKFAKPARVDLAAVQATLPADISMPSADSDGKGLTVALGLPAGARLRHFASGPKVVVDVVRSPNAEAPSQTKAGTPLPAPADAEVAPPSLQPLKAQEPPKTPLEALKAEASNPDAAKQEPTKVEPPKPAVPPKPASAESAGAASMTPPPVAGKTSEIKAASPSNELSFSLSIPWDKPVAAAVFSRAGYLWLVFDRHQQVDVKLLKRQGGEAVGFIEQTALKEGTALRLIINPDYAPSVRRDGLLWVVDLTHQPMEVKAPIAVTAPANLPTGIGISLAVADPGAPQQVADTEVGDTILVVPVIPLGAGIYPGRDSPDVEFLPSIQGVAMLAHGDGLDIKTSRSGITIGTAAGSGLRLSSPMMTNAEPELAGAPNGALLDIPGWMKGGADQFSKNRRAMLASLVNVPPARKAAAHLGAARLFFANGFAPEAIGFLRLAAEEDPTIVETAPYKALRGAANVLMERWDMAVPDLDSPILNNDPETLMWRAVAHAAVADNPASLVGDLAKGLPYIKDYPKALKWPLAAMTASVAVAASDDGAAQSSLAMLDTMASSSFDEGRVDYLRGAYQELMGNFAKAIEFYDKATNGDNREFRARAGVASVDLQRRTKKISLKDAVDKLDRLRFAWRDENFEFGLLKRLGQMQAESAAYADALRSLRSLANNYPNNKDAPSVTKAMGDIFSTLYLDGAADALSPVTAIGLYDEFRDLTPTGPRGDEMIRKLADRLASVDLLDRAAELLKHQVTYRLQGLDKARVGSQLALLDLLDQKPQEALDALVGSAMDGLPPELLQQRQHLQARALADLDRVPEAIALLAGDASQEAALLRAEIYWRKQDWPNAALAFEGLVARPERGVTLDDASARLVLSWATALTLANDERGLATLRRGFAAGMAGTTYNDGFNLLTSALDRDLPDMPAIAAKIKEAEGFKTFMGKYKARLQANGLSGIN